MRRENGTLSVEFAILVPLLIFIAVAMLSMVLLGWAKMITSDAAREGARYEALNLGSAQAKVSEVIQDGSLKPANITGVTVTENTNYVTVTVKYAQPSLVPGLPLLFGGNAWDTNFQLTSSSVFKKEKP